MRDWLAAAAEKSPDSPALIGTYTWTTLPQRVKTYAGLNVLAAREAAKLARAGVQRGDRIGLWMWSGGMYPIIVYALARLGAVLVPLNYRHTIDELSYQMEAADCKMVLYEFRKRKEVEALRTLGVALYGAYGDY